MGTRGPIGKRSEERRRRNKVGDEARVPSTHPVRIPSLPAGTRKEARAWYRALRVSGQSQFYEQGDWEFAKAMALLYHSMLEDGFTASAVKTWIDGCDRLLVTEGARRRARVELVREPEESKEDPRVTKLEGYRERLG